MQSECLSAFYNTRLKLQKYNFTENIWIFEDDKHNFASRLISRRASYISLEKSRRYIEGSYSESVLCVGATPARKPRMLWWTRVSKGGGRLGVLATETTPSPKRDLYDARASSARPLFHDFPAALRIIALTITCRLRCELSKLIAGVIAFAVGFPRRIKEDVKEELRGRIDDREAIGFLRVAYDVHTCVK